MCYHGHALTNIDVHALTNIDQSVVYEIFQINYPSNSKLTNKSN